MEKNQAPEINNLKVYGSKFQSKCIAALISDRTFLERMLEMLDPDHFETDSHKWIINNVVKYFIKYKELPTKEVFRRELEAMPPSLEALKSGVFIELQNAYNHINDTDGAYVKEQFLTFCKQMKLKTAIMRSVDHLKRGDYDSIKIEVDSAMKAGMEKNLGHDYLNEIDIRMSAMARECVKTNWGIIDKRLDGGLGKGELGFIVAPAGSGKCVGPNTEIEIQYMETGIPVMGNSGNEYILWIKPFEKYNLGTEFGELYGWQIDNIFFELEKLESSLLERERLHKK